MIAFVLRRALVLIPMLVGIALLVFLLMYLAPGDFLSAARADREVSREFIEAMEREFGLDQPWYVQFGLWLRNVVPVRWRPDGFELGANFGYSWTYKVPVTELLAQRMPASLVLACTTLRPFAFSSSTVPARTRSSCPTRITRLPALDLALSERWKPRQRRQDARAEAYTGRASPILPTATRHEKCRLIVHDCSFPGEAATSSRTATAVAQSTISVLARNTEPSPAQPAISPSAGLPNPSATSRNAV
jgi:Binding-prot-dependent transport system membrane comp, N-term